MLSCEIISESTVADVTSPLGEQIQVLYAGKKLKNLKSIFVRVVNSGGVSIKKADFEKDFEMYFGENVRILASRIDYRYPDNLSVKTLIKGNRAIESS